MRVVFVNRFYWPDTPATGQLLTDLASSAAQAGLEVIVVTGRGDSFSAPGDQEHGGVRIVRTWAPRWARRTITGKALAFLAFWIGATWRLTRLCHRGDVIVAMTDPPLIGVAAWLVAMVRRCSTVQWAQDIYPEVAIAVTGHRWLGLFSPVRNAAWRHASACVVLSREMAEVLAGAGAPRGRISAIPNWAPVGLHPLPAAAPEVIALRRDWMLDGKFAVAYSGNLGRVHDLETIVGAADLLRNDPDVMFLFIGDGAQRTSTEQQATRLGLANIQFVAAQARAALGVTLAVGDVHLVTIRAGCEPYVFPSKIYGIVAAGRPVIFIGPPGCELAQLITNHALGAVVANGDARGLADVIRDLHRHPESRQRYADAAERYAHSIGDSSINLWIDLLAKAKAC